MENPYDSFNATDSRMSAPEARFGNLDTYGGLDKGINVLLNRNNDSATMAAYEGKNGLTIFDGDKDIARAGQGNEDFNPKGDKSEKDSDDEHKRGEEDVQWAKELMGARENNAEAKDLKEAIERAKPNEMTAVYDELKNLKHDDAIKILKENFDKIAGSDNEISPQELANAFDQDKNPKHRAAYIYATRNFDVFSKANNWRWGDFVPSISEADLDKAKKPGH